MLQEHRFERNNQFAFDMHLFLPYADLDVSSRRLLHVDECLIRSLRHAAVDSASEAQPASSACTDALNKASINTVLHTPSYTALFLHKTPKEMKPFMQPSTLMAAIANLAILAA